MAFKNERTKNTNNVATVGDLIEITVDTAVVASVADSTRIYWAVSAREKDIYIRFMPAATDGSDRKGIYLKKDQFYEMPTDNIYTGEISIINKKNNEEPEYSITTF